MKAVFKWIGGATWTLSLDGLKIACDPVLCKAGTVQDYFWFTSRRLNDPAFTGSDFEGVDLWLLTHGHEDHLDTEGLKVISGSQKIIANVGGAKKGTWMGSLTLTSKMLKRFGQVLHPKLIIPVHHGTFSHYNEPIERLFRHADMPVVKISVGEETDVG